FVSFYWAWTELAVHGQRIDAESSRRCRSDIKVTSSGSSAAFFVVLGGGSSHSRVGRQVSLASAAWIEGVGTAALTFFGDLLAEKSLNPYKIPMAVLVTGTVFVCLDRTGGYFNPLLASARRWGCEGATFWQHCVGYWVGSAAGELARRRGRREG
ncbi:unnamed protein product, partial [Darwinula stevensoni]